MKLKNEKNTTIMSKRIKAADLPEFDAARYLDSETTIAAYLADILGASDAAFRGSGAERHP